MSAEGSEEVEHQAPWVFFVTVGASLSFCALVMVLKALVG